MYLLFTPCLHFWKWSKIVARVARRIWKKSLIFYECVHIWIPSPPLPEIFWENKLREGGILDVCLYIWIPPPCQWNWSKIPASLMQVTQARLVRGKGLFILRCGLRRWPICKHLRHVMGVFAFNPLPALLKMIKNGTRVARSFWKKSLIEEFEGRGDF